MNSRFRPRRYRVRRDSARRLAEHVTRRATLQTARGSIRWGLGLAWLGAILVALVLQTSVMGRIRILGVSPDLLTVAVAYAAFRVRDNGVLVLGFVGGLLLDVSGASVIGLWSFSMTLVAWAAALSREHGGRGVSINALRILLLTLLGILAHALISITFGEWSLAIWEALRLVALTPILNLALAIVLFPVSSRLWVPSLK